MANVYYYYCFLLFTILFSEINSQPTDYYLNQKADYFPYNFVRPQLNSLGNHRLLTLNSVISMEHVLRKLHVRLLKPPCLFIFGVISNYKLTRLF